jgi:hypothetical protein
MGIIVFGAVCLNGSLVAEQALRIASLTSLKPATKRPVPLDNLRPQLIASNWTAAFRKARRTASMTASGRFQPFTSGKNP